LLRVRFLGAAAKRFSAGSAGVDAAAAGIGAAAAGIGAAAADIGAAAAGIGAGEKPIVAAEKCIGAGVADVGAGAKPIGADATAVGAATAGVGAGAAGIGANVKFIGAAAAGIGAGAKPIGTGESMEIRRREATGKPSSHSEAPANSMRPSTVHARRPWPQHLGASKHAPDHCEPGACGLRMSPARHLRAATRRRVATWPDRPSRFFALVHARRRWPRCMNSSAKFRIPWYGDARRFGSKRNSY